ncbi:HTH-type transcriptional regulator AcrR [compost metagenome]|jgi:AcrR family transcriptional regulator
MNKKAAAHMPSGIAVVPAKARLSIRDAQKQMTRERLLDSALELFEELGFRGVTIDKIMKHAQANRATFYLHFKDKLDIAWALGQRQCGAEHTSLFQELDKLESPTPEDVLNWVRRRVALSTANPTLIHVMNEAVTSEPHFAAEYGAYLGRVAERVMVRTLGYREGRDHELARSKFIQLVMMMDRYVLYAEHHQLGFLGGCAVEAIAEMLWDALFRELGPA